MPSLFAAGSFAGTAETKLSRASCAYNIHTSRVSIALFAGISGSYYEGVFLQKESRTYRRGPSTVYEPHFLCVLR